MKFEGLGGCLSVSQTLSKAGREAHWLLLEQVLGAGRGQSQCESLPPCQGQGTPLSCTARAQAVVMGEGRDSASPVNPPQGPSPPGKSTRTERWRQIPGQPSKKSFQIQKQPGAIWLL